MKQLSAIGGIESIQLSGEWFELPQEPNPFSDGWQRLFILKGDSDAQIAFSYRGEAVDSESATAFRDIISIGSTATDGRELTSFEIVKLQDVMGRNTAGDNQFSNESAAGAPLFELTEATVRTVASRAVLFIRGSFRSGRHYAGIFYATDAAGQEIEEIMFHSGSKKQLREHLAKFDSALNTIVWKKLL
jgi:hypothetical protein